MKSQKKDQFRPPDDALWYLPLGGTGEIGMNLSLYGTRGKWLMIDCGITFGDEMTPGIEIIMPDISFIADRRDDLVGIVITHGHEDHIGAIQYLWQQLQCPIYATKFAAELIRNKIGHTDLKNKVRIIEVPSGGGFEIGPFQVDLISVTHSIPESNMLAIKTANGNVLHTGDWKFDSEPLVGEVTDEEKLKSFGREGIMALVGDSTNALVAGRSGSERTVQDEFVRLFSQIKQRIVVTCFASNIARVRSIAFAAKANGRYVTLVGRSMWRNTETAEECGYLPEFNEFLSENEAMLSPRDKIVMICTGCQGEPRSALPRISSSDHPEVELDAGDTVLFSSREIPGNEKAIARLQNGLIAKGLKIITPDHAPIHVSGHPAQEELVELYQWTRPQLAIPVHGEARHQTEHARIASECQVPNVLIPSNGQIIRLGPGVHEVVTTVPHGRLGLDGKHLRRLDHGGAQNRKKMSYHGAAVVTVVIDARGIIVQTPQVTLMGLALEGMEGPLQGDIADVVHDAVESMPKSSRLDDAAIRHNVATAARRLLHEVYGKKPVMDVHLVRV
jgi:ribonuclease J